jgi:hypothetical protein
MICRDSNIFPLEIRDLQTNSNLNFQAPECLTMSIQSGILMVGYHEEVIQ